MLIAFEGLDGSGSSTQAKLLVERLERTGHPALATKEPTASNPIGRMIREVLQHQWEASPEALQLLFSADRAQHLKDEILPALDKGQIVVSDRYLFSTIAFGSLAVPDVEWLKQLNRLFPMPNFTFLFKLDPATCMKRVESRGQPVELFEKEEKLRNIWKTYDLLQHQYPNIHLIDASRSIAEIADEIWGIV